MKRVVARGTAAACMAATLGTGAMVSTPALAQQASLSGSIEEVLVTARRREENLQTVPIAISALGAEQMEVRAIENMEDLNKIVPNLMVSPQGVAGGARGGLLGPWHSGRLRLR
jgi:iron complex outermembrane receptor protein